MGAGDVGAIVVAKRGVSTTIIGFNLGIWLLLTEDVTTSVR